TSVLGPAGRVFYVSPDSVYVWASSWARRSRDKSSSIVFRMPLDGSSPSALRVSGSPVDQFSFLQSEDQHLNVLVMSRGNGDGMWKAEVASGDIALMRIPIMNFSDGSEVVPSSSYQPLPKPDPEYVFHNRFVGEHLLYGSGSGWGEPRPQLTWSLYVVDWKHGESHQIKLP